MALVAAAVASVAAAQSRWEGSALLDRVVAQAIANDEIPGAVLLVNHEGKVLHRKAYGSRSLAPAREPMTADTIFDCASLTKVVATTSAVMLLLEEGQVRLNDRVTAYLPQFGGGDSQIGRASCRERV